MTVSNDGQGPASIGRKGKMWGGRKSEKLKGAKEKGTGHRGQGEREGWRDP